MRMVQRPPVLDATRARALAADALVWLAGRPDDLGLFMAEAGLSPEDVRRGAGQDEFLAGLMDFILGREDLVLALADALAIAPDQPLRARAHLPGWSAP